jgi:hypothetical protein
MKQIEIPLVSERDKKYRVFEMLPGILTWLTLALPIILSFFAPVLAAYFIVAYLLMWFFKTLFMNVRMAQGYKKLQQNLSIDWLQHAKELDDPEAAFEKYPEGISPPWHYRNMIRHRARVGDRARLSELYHAVIIAVYNETPEIVEPTIESVASSNFPLDKLVIIFAVEERGGKEVHKNIQKIVDKHKKTFGHIEMVIHPKDLPNEVIGKGGNITYAGRWADTYFKKKKIPAENVIVTTLDADNRPHPQYFAAASYAYLGCLDPIHASFQPISIFTNNIWDVPAPMRVIATGNSFWNIVLGLRPHMIRNFASHSQTLRTLQDTDFWSTRTIVEDGHQFWRTYFSYDGDHEVHPILVPIYQDAVLDVTYRKTLRAQFIQIRRWAWGASDVAYVLQKGWREKNKVPKLDLFFKTMRLIEGHLSWATAPLLLLLGAFVPLYVAPEAGDSYIANQLPIIASYIQRIAMAGLFLSIYLSIRLLPPKPPRYKAHHWIPMLLQWVLLPITTIVYSSFAAINSQTRLIFGRYLGKFDATAKVVKK